ncbi:MAG: hypothetical protein ACJ71T_05780 [Actinomycetales bacterium]
MSLSALALYPHEDATTAAHYHRGISEEAVWRHFDEGYGAIHPDLSEARAVELLHMAEAMLGPKLNLVDEIPLPDAGQEPASAVTSPARPAAGTTPR